MNPEYLKTAEEILNDCFYDGKYDGNLIRIIAQALQTLADEKDKRIAELKAESYGRGMEIAAYKEHKEMWDKRLDWQIKKCMGLEQRIAEILEEHDNSGFEDPALSTRD